MKNEEARPPEAENPATAGQRCLMHEGCMLPAGHEKCPKCGKGIGGVCGACHCAFPRNDLEIAERRIAAQANRIEDDANTADNLCKSIGITESINARLQSELTQAQERVRVLTDALRDLVDSTVSSDPKPWKAALEKARKVLADATDPNQPEEPECQ
jgi:hypothetical protein